MSLTRQRKPQKYRGYFSNTYLNLIYQLSPRASASSIVLQGKSCRNKGSESGLRQLQHQSDPPQLIRQLAGHKRGACVELN